jgi:hypothetical protein
MRRVSRSAIAPFTAGIALSAFLLFSVQPLVGRLVLPAFGGVPAAWATSWSFQTALLSGTGTRICRFRAWATDHSVVLVGALACSCWPRVASRRPDPAAASLDLRPAGRDDRPAGGRAGRAHAAAVGLATTESADHCDCGA